MVPLLPTAFVDSTPLLDDPDALRDQVRTEGHAFLPGLLDRDTVLGVRRDVLETLAQHGWLADGTDPIDGIPGPEVRREAETAWWPGYAAMVARESFNRLAHEAPLVAAMGAILGDDLIVQPMKIGRVTYPGSEYPTPPHQDFFFVRGAPDVLTAWIPLGDYEVAAGGLRMLRRSHRDGLRPVRPAPGVGGVSADVDLDDPDWVGPVSYRAGDVLLFHSLTVHMAPANRSDRIRLSADFRYQSARDPLVAGALHPHGLGNGVPHWWELTRDWESTKWCEVEQPVRLSPVRIDPDHVPDSWLLRD